MSYSTGSAPDDLKLATWFNNQIIISFTCPRCDEKVEQAIDISDMLYTVSFQCNHPKCTGPNERAGYILTMYPSWKGSELDSTDRPLHQS
jgi:hypothetical protein